MRSRLRPLVLLTLAMSLVACGGGIGADAAAQRREELAGDYRAGIDDARRDIAAGSAVLYVDGADPQAALRIDRATGLPLRDAELICGTGVDVEAYDAVIAGYRAEVARALAAGELEGRTLLHKIPDEAALRARFDAEDAIVIDTAEGTLATPDGSEVQWRTATYDDVLVAFDVRDPTTGRGGSLPFNRRPLRILWDHGGTTLVALGADGSLATVDIPTRTWIAVFPPQ